MARRFFTRLKLTAGRVADYVKDVLADDDLPRVAGVAGGYTSMDAVIDQYGRVVRAANGSGGGGGTSILEQIWQAFDANADPVDTIISSGQYRVFIFFSSHNANSWKAAGSSYTVTAGKTLIVCQRFSTGTAADASRDARLFNVTDAAAIDTLSTDGRYGAAIPWNGDLAVASQLPTAAAAKNVRAEIWNADANKRAMGVVYVCREV